MLDDTHHRIEVRNRIAEVAAQLLRNEGPAAVTTRAVADAAGVQAPTIYRLFGDKDGLMDAVAEHVMATYVAAKTIHAAAASSDNVDPLDDLRAGWLMQIDFGVANPTLHALLSDPGRAASPAVTSGMRVLASRIHRIALTGRLRVSEQRAIHLVHAAGTGTINTILSTPTDQRDPGLADDMYAAALHQILSDATQRTTASPVATAVAFRALAPELDMFSAAERQLLMEWLDRAVEALTTAPQPRH